MLEYPLKEADSLLKEKQSSAQTSLIQAKEDLVFLREQITTMEVNIARVYNWDVKQRRKNSVAAWILFPSSPSSHPLPL